MKSDVELFSRLYISCQTRDGNLEDFCLHGHQRSPVEEDYTLVQRNILTCLVDLSPYQTKTSDATCIVLDGAAIIQMMKPSAAKTSDEYAQQVFIPYLSSQLRSVSRVDIVWDTYNYDSLKATARAKHGKGVKRHLVGKAAVPGNWQNFLGADSNKTKLFSFLSKALLQAFCKEDEEVVLTDGKGHSSAHSYCRMSTSWPHAAMKKLIVVCYCTYHTPHCMATIRCSFALLTPMLWSWLYLP